MDSNDITIRNSITAIFCYINIRMHKGVITSTIYCGNRVLTLVVIFAFMLYYIRLDFVKNKQN